MELVHKLVIGTSAILAGPDDVIRDNDLFVCKSEEEYQEIKTLLYNEWNRRHPVTIK